LLLYIVVGVDGGGVVSDSGRGGGS